VKRPRAWKLGGALVVSLGFPGLAVYWAMAPSSQVYGTIITHGPRQENMVALTFDDGPNDPWTMLIADELESHQVQATFFLIGQNVDARPDLAKALVARGDLIGNHTYHHQKRYAIFQPRYNELDSAEKSIFRATGVCPALFRAPNGFHTPWQLHAVASHHMRTVGWDVQPNDWERHDPSALAKSVIAHTRPGSIIVLHDGQDTRTASNRSVTYEALGLIIGGLRAKGYRFVRLDELLGVQPYLKSCA